jgi:hypothetical protein
MCPGAANGLVAEVAARVFTWLTVDALVFMVDASVIPRSPG